MTAKTHGLKELEEELEKKINSIESLNKHEIMLSCDKYISRSKAILPLRPVLLNKDIQGNICNIMIIDLNEWPLLVWGHRK